MVLPTPYKFFFMNNRHQQYFQYLFYLTLFSCFLSCSTKKDGTTTLSIDKATSQASHFLINRLGDTIPTNVPILIQGKQIDRQTVAQPKIVPYHENKTAVPIRKNSSLAGKPKLIEMPKVITSVTPGKNGVPLPEKVVATFKAVPALSPKPVPALLPQMKDNASMDIQFLDIEQNMSTSSVWIMMKDSRGSLWFGTMGGGAIRYDGNSFTHFTVKEGLSDNHVFSMLEDSKGNLWFGTRNGGATRYDGHNFAHFNVEGGLAHNYILSIIEVTHGGMVALTVVQLNEPEIKPNMKIFWFGYGRNAVCGF